MAERTFKTVDGPEFIKLGESENADGVINTVEGQLIEKDNIQIRGTGVGKYSFEREDGTAFSMLGAKLLDEKMAFVDVGSYVRITLETEKMRTASGNEMKVYTVQVAE